MGKVLSLVYHFSGELIMEVLGVAMVLRFFFGELVFLEFLST